ncbi:HTH-type transcriptional regulator AbgR [Serratia entomophila]|jgi:LysR family transcriptional regulator of gallate degradation|uniref:LysR family transcriptional regulator n=1 Tax=Serratia entomophila TaxID=42906 RepID=A0ABY5CYE8_9GAMM|nr:LysR family transcriptional regulator [Serratia entomophila]UIW20352.1 LysR family transcriptional regulator [Serratia entomophila]USV02853.1 LysR family transcriptional regulator [Serratia entomophila]CAI0839846.1 HTH-type transcriptional regulator AbgR [Serratia entomophila]CAI1145496.1 HTH-type transcriptional regulator AbgR [Serratia entomophila]CAI1145597.1 HTH-type transcriptional regulator AbgR [Serratia entomophila]
MEYDESALTNLMQIRAFSQVVAQGSVSRAAAELFRTQSAITRSIRDLELRLAVPLFERHASGMLLTDFGKCVLPRARRAIAELHQIPALLHRLQGKGTARGDAEPLYLFNVRRLQIFVCLCETRHMQTVATLLGLSQPAISAALKVLENGAGVALLERTPHGMVPSLAGREIEPNVRRALNELQHIPADIAARRGVLEGRVRVGALPLGRTRLLPQAIVQLTSRYPGVSVVTNESAFDALASELRSGDIDFIFGALRASDYAADVYNETLFTEAMVLLARRGHPLAQPGLQPGQLKEARWVLPRSATPARRLLDDCFLAMEIPVANPVVETGDLALVRGLLLNSDMLAAVSAHQLEHELASGELVRLPLALPDTERAIGLTCRTGSLHSPAAQALIDCLRQVCAA